MDPVEAAQSKADARDIAFIDAVAEVMLRRKICACELPNGIKLTILPAALVDKPVFLTSAPRAKSEEAITDEIAGPFRAFNPEPPPPWKDPDPEEAPEPGAYSPAPDPTDPDADLDENRLFGTDLPQIG